MSNNKQDKSVIFWYGMVNNGSNVTPVVTIASRINREDNTVNRGIAICSADENPSREIGRRIAMKRLLLAEHRKMNCSPINWAVDGKVAKSGYGVGIVKNCIDIPQWTCKAQYHSSLLHIEDKVFNNPNKK